MSIEIEVSEEGRVELIVEPAPVLELVVEEQAPTEITVETTEVQLDVVVGVGTPGPAGVGIDSIVLTSTVGLVKTYTITYTDASTDTFSVSDGVVGSNGVGISGIALISTVGLVKTYRITFTNAATFDFTTTDGTAGPAGSPGFQTVHHGVVGSTARPSVDTVYWVGTATPANAVAWDQWLKENV